MSISLECHKDNTWKVVDEDGDHVLVNVNELIEALDGKCLLDDFNSDRCDNCDERITDDYGYCPDCDECHAEDHGYCPDCDRGDCGDCSYVDPDNQEAGEERVCRSCERIEESEVAHLMELINEHVPEQYVQKLLKAMDEPKPQPLRLPDKGYIDTWVDSTGKVRGLAAYVPKAMYVMDRKGFATASHSNTPTHVAINFDGLTDNKRRLCENVLERYGLKEEGV